jgi:hypothetical protein
MPTKSSEFRFVVPKKVGQLSTIIVLPIIAAVYANLAITGLLVIWSSHSFTNIVNTYSRSSCLPAGGNPLKKYDVFWHSICAPKNICSMFWIYSSCWVDFVLLCWPATLHPYPAAPEWICWHGLLWIGLDYRVEDSFGWIGLLYTFN